MSEWAGIDPLEARRMIEGPLKARGVDARYIRKILPKKYKYEYQDRTKKRQIEHDDPANKLQKIKDLQNQVRHLRRENEILNQPFVARGLISVDGNNKMPTKVLINPKTKVIEKGELDYEALKQMVTEEYKRYKQTKQ